MIIDDEVQLLETIGSFLELNGYRTVRFTEGAPALHFLTSNEVDLILCDYLLPDLTGYDIFQQFITTPGIRKIPFFVLTAYIDNSFRTAQLERYPDLILTKPISLFLLVTEIKRYLS
jgi:two-component system OmpR family response regulator